MAQFARQMHYNRATSPRRPPWGLAGCPVLGGWYPRAMPAAEKMTAEQRSEAARLAVLGVWVSFPNVPATVLSEHLLGIWPTAKADLAIWA